MLIFEQKSLTDVFKQDILDYYIKSITCRDITQNVLNRDVTDYA